MPQMFILWIQVIIRCCDYITPIESFPQAEFASSDTAASLGNSAFEQSWLDLLWSDVLGDKRWRAQEKGILRMEEITQTALSDGWERCCNSRSHWGFITHKLRSECNQGSLQQLPQGELQFCWQRHSPVSPGLQPPCTAITMCVCNV